MQAGASLAETMPMSSLRLPSAAALLIACAAPLAHASVPEVMKPGDLKPGQHAVVRTVFQGDSIEEFPAEIVGVLQGGRAEGDLILARATSERVAHLGVAQGMSGSPVYVDGKLIGALSSGWSFSRDPLFGITPIGDMLHVLDLPAADPVGQTAGPTGVDMAAWGPLKFREFRWGDDDTLADHAPATGAFHADVPGPLPMPLACAGLAAGASELVRRMLAPLGLAVIPGGRAADGGPTAASLQPGSAVAVDVLRGDLQFSAIGTVTWRDGDKVLIFGHPFFQSGEVRMPLSTARITTIVANEATSFKLGVRGREVGVATQDRRAAVAGTLGGRARMLPFSVAIRGRTPQTFHFESIEDRSLAPTLIALASLNSLMESGGSGGNQTLRWTMTLHRHGVDPLALSDIVAGDAPANDLATGIAAPLRFLFENPYQALALDSLNVQITVEPGREQWTLRSARVLDPIVRPGGNVRVACDVERWHGGHVTHIVTLTVPEEAPEGRYPLWVGGGSERARYEAQKLPGRYRPTSLDDAWQRLGQLRPESRLYASLFATAPEVTADGRDYPELPGSAISVLSSGQSAGDDARRGSLATLDETSADLGGLTHGELLLSVTVDDQAP